MPIYEYRCPSCGEVFEAYVPMNRAAEPTRCKKCGEAGAERILSATSCCAPTRGGGGAATAGAGGGCAPRGGFR